MSSENNGRKPESVEPGPPSAPEKRFSGRAPSAWGAVRDALAAVHNLETLLRNASVPKQMILDLLPELRSSGTVLRGAFQHSLGANTAALEVSKHGEQRLDELDALLDSIDAQSGDRQEDRELLASRAGVLADELEAYADLVALLERAGAPVPTEVSLDLIAHEAGRMSGTARGQELLVRFQGASPDCVVTTDPYVLGPLLSLVVAHVHLGIEALAVRARSVPEAGFVVEPAGPEDEALPTVSMRVMPWVGPSELAVRCIAEQIGVSLELSKDRGSIVLT